MAVLYIIVGLYIFDCRIFVKKRYWLDNDQWISTAVSVLLWTQSNEYFCLVVRTFPGENKTCTNQQLGSNGSLEFESN